MLVLFSQVVQTLQDLGEETLLGGVLGSYQKMVEVGYTLRRTHRQKASASKVISEAVREAGPGRLTYSLNLHRKCS